MSHSPDIPTVAIVLAGGSGSRLGSSVPKQFLELGGRSVLEHAVAAMQACEHVSEIVVVVHEDHLVQARTFLSTGDLDKVAAVVPGGVTRADSTRRALAVLGDRECNVLVHDAARPLVSAQTVRDCVRALTTCEAVVVATPAVDTVLRVDEGERVVEVPDRRHLRQAQTPQGFRLSILRQAHELAQTSGDASATDDCSLVVRHLPQVVVHVLRGDERNLKLTRATDLLVLRTLLDGSEGSG